MEMLIRGERQQLAEQMFGSLQRLAEKFPKAIKFNTPPKPGMKISFERRELYGEKNQYTVDHHKRMETDPSQNRREANPTEWGPMSAFIITAILFLLKKIDPKDYSLSYIYKQNSKPKDLDEALALTVFNLMKEEKTNKVIDLLLNQKKMSGLFFQEFMIKQTGVPIPEEQPIGIYQAEVIKHPEKDGVMPPIVLIRVPYQSLPPYDHWHRQIFTIIKRLGLDPDVPYVTMVLTRWIFPDALKNPKEKRGGIGKEKTDRVCT